MIEPLPIVLIPRLLCSARLYAEQIPELWLCGPVILADHTRDDSMAAIARRILAAAPQRRRASPSSACRWVAISLLKSCGRRRIASRSSPCSTLPRADTPEQSAQRRIEIALAEHGRFAEVPDLAFPRLVKRQEDEALRRMLRLMADDVGPEAFVRQQTAIMGRSDSLPGLAAIRCPTLVLVGDSDTLTPPDRSTEIANGIFGARLVIVPDCGHVSTMEQPRQVTNALVESLQAW